jgi:endoglucanase
MIAHKETAKQLMSIADEREIPYQRKASAAGGQDAAAGQRAGNGSRAVNLAVGTRYIHTVTEMVDKRDLQAALDLTIAFLEEC